MAWASSGHSYLWAKEKTITEGGKPAVLGPHKLLSGLLYWSTELLQPRLRCLSLCSNKTYLKWLSYPRQARNAHRHSIQHLLVPDNQKERDSLCISSSLDSSVQASDGGVLKLPSPEAPVSLHFHLLHLQAGHCG